MRKVKRVLAVLSSAAMIISTIGMTTYANDALDVADPANKSNFSERQLEWAEKIAKERPYNDLVEPLVEFVYENCYSKARVIENMTDENGNSYCMVNYYYTDTDVKPAVEAFLKKNGYDSSKVVFNAVGEHIANEKKITDPFEAFAILWKYVADNNLDWAVNMGSFDHSKITVSVYEDKIEDAKAVVEKNNIDDDLIEWNLWGVRHYTTNDTSSDLGDANDDGKTNVRDCACIANALANGKADSLPDQADYNQDTHKNVRDAAAISNDLANK